MPDAYDLFRSTPNKHRTLATLWPALHEELSGKAADGSEKPQERVLPCVLQPCASKPSGQRPAAVARICRWGPPACAEHIKQLADRPGGWPIDLKGHRKP